MEDQSTTLKSGIGKENTRRKIQAKKKSANIVTAGKRRPFPIHVCMFVSFHEINMQFDDDVTLHNNGHYKYAFSYSRSFDGSKMVMKELRFEHDNRMDNTTFLPCFWRTSSDRCRVAMGQLSNSDNTPNIYASCSNAQIVDVSPDGDLEQHILIGAEHCKKITHINPKAAS